MRIFTWRRATLASLVAITMVGLAASPALAGEKPTPIEEKLPIGAELQIAQGPLVELANAVGDTDPERNHLAGIQLEIEQRAVHIYWKGDVPDDVYRLVDEARGNGIEATLEEARYAGAEMTKAQHEVADKHEAYPGLTSVGPMTDGSGLRVGAVDPRAFKSETFPLEATIVQEEPATPTARQNDTPPFWAGGAARPSTGGFCSTGFAVAHYNWFGQEVDRGLLTADHCSPGGNASYFTGVGRFIGSSGSTGFNPFFPFSDTQFIRSASGARVFGGGVTSSMSRAVTFRTGVWPGMTVCTSGAATGEHCSVVVYATGLFSFLSNGQLVLGVDYGMDTTIAGVASGTGDSGGPVYALDWWDPTRRVWAAGMIDNGLFTVGCPAGSLTATCFRNVGFVDINYAVHAQGVEILTS